MPIRNKKKFLNFGAIFLLLVFLLVFYEPAHAVKLPRRGGFGVVPTKISFKTSPGAESTFDLSIINDDPQAYDVSFSAWNFARDEKGNPYPIGPKDVKVFRGCADWLSFSPTKMRVRAGEDKPVTVKVKVQPDPKIKGTHYAYIKVLASPTIKKKGQTIVNYEINALLLAIVDIPGSPVPVLERKSFLKEFSVKPVNYTNSIDFTARVRNAGNVHLDLTGRIDIKRGKSKVEAIPIKESTLLPVSTFPIFKSWEDPPLLGKFTAKFTGDVGLEKPLRAERSFWVISWRLILWVALGLVLLATFLILFLRRFTLVRR